ncbi:MAG: DNA (cytosine-5-)-methyltransferase [Clostridia bacterium]|nr:DNA (cytosine-5-)-methyltransferase [Clostridia bacterium]
MEKAKFKFIDLFAGLGGFHLAMEKLGGECVFASELQDDLRELYKENYGIDCAGDITKVDYEKDIPPHDVLCGGFPCQPFSKAGKQQGFNDDKDRGNMFLRIMEIIEIHKPKYIFLENVPNLKSHDNGNTYDVIIKNLEQYYDIADDIISPHHFGIPQHRTRFYLVGKLKQSKDDKPLSYFSFPKHEEKHSCDINSILCPDDDDYMSLKEITRTHLAVWQEFLDILSENNVKVPSFPSVQYLILLFNALLTRLAR